MGIYSVNGGRSTVKVNGTYSMTDCGRIMCESATNDQNLFAAILASDYNEAIGLYEGTLLESEVEEKNKKDSGGLLNSIKTALQKFLQKICDIYDSAISRMMVLLTDCKRDLKRWNDAKAKITSRSWTIKGDYRSDTASKEINLDSVLSEEKLRNMVTSNNGQKASNMQTVSVVLANALADIGAPKPDGDLTRTSFKKAMFDFRFVHDAVINNNNIESKVITPMTNSKGNVKALMTEKKNVSKKIDEWIKKIKDEQKKLEKNQRVDSAAIMRAASVFQSALNIITNARISMYFQEVTYCRKNLAKAIKAVSGEKEDKVNEAFVLQEIEDRTNEIMSDLPGVDGDNPEVREEFADEINELSESGFVFSY